MNCLQFRRTLMVNPDSQERDFLQHMNTCPDCAKEAQRAWRFEEKLHSALSTEPPDGLEARILLAQTAVRSGGHKHPRHRHWTVAAGFLLAMGLSAWLGFQWQSTDTAGDGLDQLVLNHVHSELHHLEEPGHVTPEAVQLTFAQFGAHAGAGLGQVRYIGRCHIRNQAGVHMVLSGEQGPVTVLVMPGEHVEHRLQLNSADFSGLIVPTEYGSLAVLGNHQEPLDRALEKIRTSVHWGGNGKTI